MTIDVIGAGLAGVEAATTLTRLGYNVDLYEMKPERFSKAHSSALFAELVCSNSFKAQRLNSAAGLLKEEARLLGSLVVETANRCSVEAGGALAVNRDIFSSMITKSIKDNKKIRVINKEVTSIDSSSPTIVATGPLTDGALADTLVRLTGGFLSFYDAASPIVTYDSIDMSRVYKANRYDYDSEGDYLNCFLDKESYERFHEELVGARIAIVHNNIDDEKVYEGCMPIEKQAKRGIDAIRFGPMKPVGLKDPSTGRRPYAAVQLRKEDQEARLYNIVGFQTNLIFSEQKRVFGMIPGLEKAQYARYGVMHRNSFLDSPKLLNSTLNLKEHRNIYIAGQLTGFEGYIESAISGILAAVFIHNMLSGKDETIPAVNTMSGALLRYITSKNANFQPMGANMGILPPLEVQVKDKRERYMALALRGLDDMRQYIFTTDLQ